MARICFFARVENRAVLERVEFYADDIRILRSLRHDVTIATKLSEIVKADLYFCWWWTWAFIPLSVARILGKPVVITGVFDEWMYDDRPWIQRLLLRYALKASQANVFISRLEERIVPARFRVRAPSFSPCLVDSEKYAPPKPGQPKEKIVLTVAWLHEANVHRKGIAEIVRAAAFVRARVPEARFVIAGERGSGYPALQALAEELGVSDIVEFCGVLSVEAKIDLMGRCGVYLQPSRFEGFGLAVLEAMSCGAAIVVSSGGALPEVVGDAGAVLPDTRPESIAARVCELLESPSRAAEYGALARKRATSEFSFERRRSDMKNVIDPLLESSRQ